MTFTEKKKYYKLLKLYQDREEIITKAEAEYKTKLLIRYLDYIHITRQQVSLFLEENNFNILQNKDNIIEAIFESNYRFVLTTPPPKPLNEYHFNFTEIDNKRNSYIIVLKPNRTFTIPKTIELKPEPSNVKEIETLSKKLDDDYFFYKEESEKIRTESFHFIYFHEENKHPNYDSLRKYYSFKSIMKQILE